MGQGGFTRRNGLGKGGKKDVDQKTYNNVITGQFYLTYINIYGWVYE